MAVLTSYDLLTRLWKNIYAPDWYLVLHVVFAVCHGWVGRCHHEYLGWHRPRYMSQIFS